jgi:hypothetical protein
MLTRRCSEIENLFSSLKGSSLGVRSLCVKNYKVGAKYISYVVMANRLPAWRKDEQTSWLKESPAHPLPQTKHYDLLAFVYSILSSHRYQETTGGKNHGLPV